MLNTNAGLWPQMAANSADAETVDPWGLGTVIETQARLWNHLLDANRNFWTGFNWQVPTAPWINGAAVAGAAGNNEPAPVRKPRAPAKKKTAKRSRSA